MTEMQSIPGIVKRVEPDPDPSPSLTLSFPTAEFYIRVEFDEDELSSSDYKDKLRGFSEQIYNLAASEKNLQPKKAKSLTSEAVAEPCKMRIEFELKNNETFKWEMRLRPPHSASEK